MRFRRVALEENMRRADREVTDYGRMLDILQQCDCCRLGFVDGEGALSFLGIERRKTVK